MSACWKDCTKSTQLWYSKSFIIVYFCCIVFGAQYHERITLLSNKTSSYISVAIGGSMFMHRMCCDQSILSVHDVNVKKQYKHGSVWVLYKVKHSKNCVYACICQWKECSKPSVNVSIYSIQTAKWWQTELWKEAYASKHMLHQVIIRNAYTDYHKLIHKPIKCERNF